MTHSRDNRAQRVERLAGISSVRAGAGGADWGGAAYALGISAETVGSTTLSMNVARLPPGGQVAAHIHEGYEVGLHVIQGQLEHRFGPGLRERVINGPGDFIFVAPGVPHVARNLSATEPVVVVVARTTPHDWEQARPYEAAVQ